MTQEQSKMIDIEKILQDNYNPWTVNQHDDPCYTIQIVKDIVREAIQQALELAAENALMKITSYKGSYTYEGEYPLDDYSYIDIDKKSIISVNELVK